MRPAGAAASSTSRNFNPRTPCGVRPSAKIHACEHRIFQSTHPLRGATRRFRQRTGCWLISIHAPLAGCDSGCDRGHVHFPISIHAPLAGCDRGSGSRAPTITISIHAPLAGCDAFRFCSCCASGNFNPRTPCGVRLADACLTKDELEFQSTHPLRGATSSRCRSACRRRISIHAPLAGCDALSRLRSSAAIDFNPRTPCGVRPARFSGSGCWRNFNPRTPCGVRRVAAFSSSVGSGFQSTHPLRGATSASDDVYIYPGISIHAPLAGCDGCYPIFKALREISIHAPLAGCDAVIHIKTPNDSISIHAPLAGCDCSCA